LSAKAAAVLQLEQLVVCPALTHHLHMAVVDVVVPMVVLRRFGTHLAVGDLQFDYLVHQLI
jgi:hypothetical protein